MDNILVWSLLATGCISLFLFLLIKMIQSPATMPASASSDDGDIVLGKVKDSLSLVKLSEREQLSHGSILGRSGRGKSRLLEAIFIQRFYNGKGTGIVEPHHDLSFDTLSYLVSVDYFRNADAFDRLIYIDWGSGDFVPFNILQKNGRDTYTTTKNALDAMVRVWPELTSAPAFQRLFEASVATLVENNLPITFLHQLVTDKSYRDQCLRQVADPVIHQAFASFEELGRDAPMEKASLERRAFALCFSPITRYTLGQPTNALNFREIMDAGKSFIINLGHIQDTETRKMIGSFLLLQIEQAAMSRADIEEEDRVPFNLIIDEWPSFAAHGPTISEILSQCRKYQLYLYLSAQSSSQTEASRLAGAMENCNIKIAFGLGSDSAVEQSRQIGDVDVLAIKEEALTMTQHNQYFSVSDQYEQWAQSLQKLPPRFTFVKKGEENTVCMQTVNMPRAEVDKAERDQVLWTYRRRYQRTKEEAEAAIASLRIGAEESESGSLPQTKTSPTHARTYKSRATPQMDASSNDRSN